MNLSEPRNVIVGQTIALEMEVKDANGVNIAPDSTPAVEIRDPQNTVTRNMSASDVILISVGRYRLNYDVPAAGRDGSWNDKWQVVVNGASSIGTLVFTVIESTDGIVEAEDEIGDDARTTYSEEEIIGINILLAQIKARLKNNVEVESTDAYGNIEYVQCSVFTNDELKWFLQCSLSEFNQTPHFTDFLFSAPVIYDRFAYAIVEGAFILALGAQMLIEAGRQFTITDNGVTLTPPPLAEILNNQLSQFVTRHTEALKQIKWSIKPQPVGFGGFRVLAVNPAYMRLRHLRQRRII